jgi:hypothetical protein
MAKADADAKKKTEAENPTEPKVAAPTETKEGGEPWKDNEDAKEEGNPFIFLKY